MKEIERWKHSILFLAPVWSERIHGSCLCRKRSAIGDWFSFRFWPFDELHNKAAVQVEGQEYVLECSLGPWIASRAGTWVTVGDGEGRHAWFLLWITSVVTQDTRTFLNAGARCVRHRVTVMGNHCDCSLQISWCSSRCSSSVRQASAEKSDKDTHIWGASCCQDSWDAPLPSLPDSSWSIDSPFGDSS